MLLMHVLGLHIDFDQLEDEANTIIHDGGNIGVTSSDQDDETKTTRMPLILVKSVWGLHLDLAELENEGNHNSRRWQHWRHLLLSR